MTDPHEGQLSFIEVFGNADRLRISGLLLGRRMSVGESAAALGASPASVQRHDLRLVDARYVTLNSEGAYAFDRDTAALRRGLVDARLMARDHGAFWRLKTLEP